MNDRIAQGNLYELLGVSPAASPELIRLAYFTNVRKINPRTDPARFQSISQAYAILSNPSKKREYDQQNLSGKQVRGLVDQAASMAMRDPFKAMNLLQNALSLAPDMPRVHVLLGHVYMRLEKYQQAEEQYKWLLERKPSDEQMRLRLARCLAKQHRYKDAEIEIGKLMKYFPLHYEALLVLSQVLDAQDRYEEVLDVLENAIKSDGIEDFNDLFALLTLLSIHGQAQRWDGVAQTAIRVLNTIKSPEQGRKAAQKMLSMAMQKREEKEYDTAQALLTCATHIPLDEEDKESRELKERVHTYLNYIRLAGVAQQSSQDTLVPLPLRQWINLLYIENLPANAREQRLGGLLKDFAQHIDDDAITFLAGISYFKKEYKELAQDQSRLVENVQQRAEKAVALQNQSMQNTATQNSTNSAPSKTNSAPSKTNSAPSKTSSAPSKPDSETVSEVKQGFLGRFWKKTG
jgi:tetratricopeptide (TPR) repeat protein